MEDIGLEPTTFWLPAKVLASCFCLVFQAYSSMLALNGAVHKYPFASIGSQTAPNGAV